MNIRVVPPSRLSADELGVWSTLQRENPQLQSPYFCPEFTLAVAAVRDDVEVAVLRKPGAIVGFFPFQRTLRGIGRPAGGKLSDFQAVITAAGQPFDPLELIRACGLTAWHFDHLAPGSTPFAPYIWRQANSPFIELPDGFEAYGEQFRKRSDVWNRLRSKRRKLERDVGTVRFEPHTTAPAILAALLEWKSEQYRRTNIPDIVGVPWVRRFLETLLELRGPEFSPLLSVLWAGDRPVAISYSLRSTDVLHSWFPAYDRELHRYSPGALLLVETLRELSPLGFSRLDLGKGEESFKRQFMTGAVLVGEGTVDLRSSTAFLRQVWRSTTDLVRNSPLHGAMRTSKSMLTRFRGDKEYR